VRSRSRRVRFPAEPHGGPRWRRGAVDGTAVRWPVSRARTPQSARVRALAPVRSGRSALCGAARLAFTARVRRRRHHRRSPPPRVAAAAHHERSTGARQMSQLAAPRSLRRRALIPMAASGAAGAAQHGAACYTLEAPAEPSVARRRDALRRAAAPTAAAQGVGDGASAAGARRGLRRC
jgi:hypothetical protein